MQFINIVFIATYNVFTCNIICYLGNTDIAHVHVMSFFDHEMALENV